MRSLLILPLLLLSCSRQHANPPSLTHPAAALPTVRVQTMKLASQRQAAFEDVVGTVRSKQRAIVEAKVSGRVLEYDATPGTLVKKDQMLVRIDAQEIQAKADQAQAMLEQAKLDYDRQQRLISSNATTRQEFDAAQARVKVTTAALNEVQTQLGYATVSAPFDGMVTRKLVEVGDLAMPGKPLLELETPRALRFEADLPEALLEHARLGAKMKVRLNQDYEAVVSEISPVADPVSRTFLVKLDLPKDADLRTGQFGRVAVPVGEVERLLAPKTAVLKRGQLEIVFVTQKDRAVLRLVKTGELLQDQVEILSGLEENETVVVSDPALLIDGQPVQVQP